MFSWRGESLKFQFQSFTEICFSLGGWVEILWLSLAKNALKDLDPRIHAVWLWANALLFEKCQGVFFQISVDILSKFVQIVYEVKVKWSKVQ